MKTFYYLHEVAGITICYTQKHRDDFEFTRWVEHYRASYDFQPVPKSCVERLLGPITPAIQLVMENNGLPWPKNLVKKH